MAMRSLPHTHSCFVCGESNSSGLNLRFETDGRVVFTRFTPLPAHVGFRGTIHGGIIAAVLDEVMVWACAVRTRRFSYCAEFNVRFLNPLQPGAAVIASGELLENRKDRIYTASGEIKDGAGNKIAGATGKYMPLKDETAKLLLEDFVGDVTSILILGPPPGGTT